MPAARATMRKIREVFRLCLGEGWSQRRVAQSTGLGRATVGEYLRRLTAAGLDWAQASAMDEGTLEAKLFPPVPPPGTRARSEPDWAEVHRELKRKGVTLMLLWQEYKAAHPDGFQYTWFCDQYRAWAGKLDLVMRQDHRAGEKLFLDYSGQTMPVIDRHSGEIRTAEIFIAVLGASGYTYVEATWTQSLPDWCASHVRALEFFGGSAGIYVPDNLKSAVHKPHRYEPDLNPTYAELAAHYGAAVLPARVRKPRDKPRAESGVLLAQRWILARLRNRPFFSLGELNAAIAELRERLNDHPFQKLAGSRRSVFETLERPALKPLPAQPFEYAEWKQVRVHIDYHVALDGHYYSVPYPLIKQQLQARISAHTVELFHRGQRVASHRRSPLKGRHTTVSEHMPRAHREYAEWTPQRLVRWAEHNGPATAALIEAILVRRAHPQQGFRSALGILRLGKHYGAERLEAACRRALRLQAYSYKSLESILKRGLDQQPLPEADPETPLPEHANVRGPGYFH